MTTTDLKNFFQTQGMTETLSLSEFFRSQGMLLVIPQKIIFEKDDNPYSYRYPDNWDEIRHRAKVVTKGRCSYPGCFCDKGLEVHHAYYMLRGELRTASPDIYKQLFPLCPDHHKDRSNPQCAHYKSNWIKGRLKTPMEGDSRNSKEYYQLLIQGKREKMS